MEIISEARAKSKIVAIPKRKIRMKEVPFQTFEKLRSSFYRFRKLSLINRVYRLITYLVSVYFLVEGHRMYVDIRDPLYTPHLLYVWEKYETELFKKVVKKGMVVVDIGANIGWYTLIAAKLVGTKGKVYAFEPDPDNCALLRKNVQKNGYNNVIVEQKAILNRCGVVRLFLSSVSIGDHRIYGSHNGRKWIDVQGTTLDEYFRNKHDRIDIIKIDTQGAEMAAFLGMDRIIKTNENLKIFTEFWPNGITMAGFSPKGFLDKLLEYGFTLHAIDERNEVMKPTNVNEAMKLCDGRTQVDEVMKLSGGDYVNLFLER